MVIENLEEGLHSLPANNRLQQSHGDRGRILKNDEGQPASRFPRRRLTWTLEAGGNGMGKPESPNYRKAFFNPPLIDESRRPFGPLGGKSAIQRQVDFYFQFTLLFHNRCQTRALNSSWCGIGVETGFTRRSTQFGRLPSDPRRRKIATSYPPGPTWSLPHAPFLGVLMSRKTNAYRTEVLSEAAL